MISDKFFFFFNYLNFEISHEKKLIFKFFFSFLKLFISFPAMIPSFEYFYFILFYLKYFQPNMLSGMGWKFLN